MEANVLVEFENVFFTIGGKKLFWDRENQLFWELYGPLYTNCQKLQESLNISSNIEKNQKTMF